MKQIVLASTNQGKVREVAMMVQDMGIEIVPLSETAFQGEIEETGTTFEENAIIKAMQVAKTLGIPALADDSGLEIDYLNGEPGIYSARYLGEDTSYRIKNANLIERLDGVPKEQRTARFVCAIAAVLPSGTENEKALKRELVVRGTVEGYIGWEERGTNGFGYDPIFYVDEYGCSTAELDSETKNRISHRGNALRLCEERLKELL